MTFTAGQDNQQRRVPSPIGAETVFDYSRDYFTRQAERYDEASEAVAKSSFGARRHLVKPGGRYVTTLPGPGVFLEASEAGHMRGKIVLEI